MACPFLDKLAAEIRVKIYEYALTSEDDVPLVRMNEPWTSRQKRVKHLEPEDQGTLEHESPSWQFDEALPFGPVRVNTNILLVNKKIYTEAIEVFYRVNIISVDCGLYMVENPRPLSVSTYPHNEEMFFSAKRLFVRLEKPMVQCQLEYFLLRIYVDFPHLSNLQLRVDRTDMPFFILLILADICHREWTPHKPRFDEVGSFSFETEYGFRMDVEFEKLKTAWRTCTTMPHKDIIKQARKARHPDAPFFNAVCDAYERTQDLLPHGESCTCESDHQKSLREYMAEKFPDLAASGYGNLEFWTLYAGLRSRSRT